VDPLKLVIAAPPPPSSLTNIVRVGSSVRKVGSGSVWRVGRAVSASSLAVLALAGCGGKATRTTSTTPIVAAPSSRSPSTVATCLNGRSFLVQASPHRVSGSSPGGVNFEITFFANATAALAAKTTHHYRTQLILPTTDVGIDDSGNPPGKGGKAMTLAAVDLHTIVVCVLHG
jgi:hypothetical protein